MRLWLCAGYVDFSVFFLGKSQRWLHQPREKSNRQCVWVNGQQGTFIQLLTNYQHIFRIYSSNTTKATKNGKQERCQRKNLIITPILGKECWFGTDLLLSLIFQPSRLTIGTNLKLEASTCQRPFFEPIKNTHSARLARLQIYDFQCMRSRSWDWCQNPSETSTEALFLIRKSHSESILHSPSLRSQISWSGVLKRGSLKTFILSYNWLHCLLPSIFSRQLRDLLICPTQAHHVQTISGMLKSKLYPSLQLWNN
jgi:hypothetical protein